MNTESELATRPQAYERTASARLRMDYAIGAREQELELFWKRSLFFWGFIASAFIGYAATAKEYPQLGLALASFGLVCSVAWTLANRGSKYWQENWERNVNEVEWEVVGPLFSVQNPRQSKGPFSGYRFSVSRLAIGLSDFTVILWAAIMGISGRGAFQLDPISAEVSETLFVIAASVTIAYCVGLVVFCRPSKDAVKG